MHEKSLQDPRPGSATIWIGAVLGGFVLAAAAFVVLRMTLLARSGR